MKNLFNSSFALAFVLCSAAAWSGCGRSDKTEAGPRQFETRGIVRGFAPDRSTIDIEHEDIPGFMPSMTMPFSVRNQKEIADSKIGDAISFRMSVTDRDLLVDQAIRPAPRV